MSGLLVPTNYLYRPNRPRILVADEARRSTCTSGGRFFGENTVVRPKSHLRFFIVEISLEKRFAGIFRDDFARAISQSHDFVPIITNVWTWCHKGTEFHGYFSRLR